MFSLLAALLHWVFCVDLFYSILFISHSRNPNQATQPLDTEQVKAQQQNTIQAIQVIKTQHK
jgi:hypothetical protein